MHYLLEGLKPKTFTSFLVILQYDSQRVNTDEEAKEELYSNEVEKMQNNK